MSDQTSPSEDIGLPNRPRTVVGTAVFVLVVLIVASLWKLSAQPVGLSIVLLTNLVALSWYDLHYFRLPNLLTMTLASTSLTVFLTIPQILVGDHLIGGFVGLVFFPLLNAVYLKLRGRSGIGMGDAKLLGGVGLWLGWQHLPFVLLAASVLALAFVSLFFLFASRENRKQVVKKPAPFGVFLCLGAWWVWLFPQI